MQSPSSANKPQRLDWKAILLALFNQIEEDRMLAVAAGVVFYMQLALFPGLAALVSLYGLFADPSDIAQHLSLLDKLVPQGSLGLIRDQVMRLSHTSHNLLSYGFFFSLAFALWSANYGMKALIGALNVVYEEREQRSFIKLTLVAFAFTMGGLVFIVLALAAVVVVPLVFSWFGFQWQAAGLVAALRWPALLVIVTLWLALLYRYGPSRARPRWHWLDVGSLVATVLWLAGSALFSWYLSNVAHYDVTYGSVGAVIGLMMWLWLSVIVVMVGAMLNAGIEHRTAQGTTAGRTRS